MFPDVLESDIDLAANLPVGVIGNADAAWLGDSLKPRCDVDTIAKNIVVVDDDVADVNANAKFDPEFRRYADVLFSHLSLNLRRTAYGVDGTGKLDQRAIAGGIDDATAVGGDRRIDQRPS